MPVVSIEACRRFFWIKRISVPASAWCEAAECRLCTQRYKRHTHATHALAKGVELSAVRDNLRHASISTTSIYLHTDDVKRARQFGQAFTA